MHDKTPLLQRPGNSKMSSLRDRLDRDVYQVVRRLESATDDKRLSVLTIYDHVKKSNSSLARYKKRPLEDSIERVLATRKREREMDEKLSDSDADAAIERKMEREERKTSRRQVFLL